MSIYESYPEKHIEAFLKKKKRKEEQKVCGS